MTKRKNSEVKALIREFIIHPWGLWKRPKFDWLTNWATEC